MLLYWEEHKGFLTLGISHAQVRECDFDASEKIFLENQGTLPHCYQLVLQRFHWEKRRKVSVLWWIERLWNDDHNASRSGNEITSWQKKTVIFQIPLFLFFVFFLFLLLLLFLLFLLLVIFVLIFRWRGWWWWWWWAAWWCFLTC